jgi:hypothetical protein
MSSARLRPAGSASLWLYCWVTDPGRWPPPQSSLGFSRRYLTTRRLPGVSLTGPTVSTNASAHIRNRRCQRNWSDTSKLQDVFGILKAFTVEAKSHPQVSRQHPT